MSFNVLTYQFVIHKTLQTRIVLYQWQHMDRPAILLDSMRFARNCCCVDKMRTDNLTKHIRKYKYMISAIWFQLHHTAAPFWCIHPLVFVHDGISIAPCCWLRRHIAPVLLTYSRVWPNFALGDDVMRGDIDWDCLSFRMGHVTRHLLLGLPTWCPVMSPSLFSYFEDWKPGLQLSYSDLTKR